MVTRWAGTRRVTAAMVGAAICSAVLAAAPAHADVTVTPDRAARGDAAKLTFRVTDDRGAAYTTKIELLLPESAPIAEVWPLTVPDWAPSVTTRTLDQPLTGVHHGRVTEVTSRITWTRAVSAEPTGAAELQVSMGPMPETDRLLFTMVQTYSDGTVVRWNEQPAADGSQVEHPAAVLTLTDPVPPQRAADGGVHGGDAGAAQPPAAGSTDGGGLGSLATGLLIGLLVGGGVAIWLARGRRGRGREESGGPVTAAAPATAGAVARPAAVRPGTDTPHELRRDAADEPRTDAPREPETDAPHELRMDATDGPETGEVHGRARKPVPARRAWRLHE